ncbi:MAG TPA: hypothetical protein VMM16_10350 [Verrucomicrobiae bacterium]|nr:hypothetical protein [Verrucomicrobiae bacterium]HUH63591.1 hypothetical protein [Terracidiphilus sp.]
MISKCANPNCATEFNHRKGMLFRFPKPPISDGLPANTHSVQHFWLCEDCSQTYWLQYDPRLGVALTLPFEKIGAPSPHKVIAAV